MLYTADGLEQASRLEVAATHAGRFYNASLATVHDLGCGIGSDAVAMSALGVTVHGVDVDPVAAAVADINLRPWPDSRARVGMAEEFEPPRDPLRARVGVWLDPARRIPGLTGRHGRIKRVFRLDEIQPTWEFVLQVATAVPATGAKLSPSMPHDAIPLGTEAQWTSYRRRGARVRRLVGSAGPATRAQRAHPAPRPLAHRGRRDDGRAAIRHRGVAGRHRPVALRTRPRRHPGGAARRAHRRHPGQRGRPRARVRRSARRSSTCRSPGAMPCSEAMPFSVRSLRPGSSSTASRG